MPRTYSDVMSRARAILQDEDSSNYRYPDQDILDGVNDALLEVRRLRADLFASADFAVADKAIGDITDPLPIPDMYFSVLPYFVAGYTMLRDDEFSLDSRAVNLLNKATSQLLRAAA